MDAMISPIMNPLYIHGRLAPNALEKWANCTAPNPSSFKLWKPICKWNSTSTPIATCLPCGPAFHSISIAEKYRDRLEVGLWYVIHEIIPVGAMEFAPITLVLRVPIDMALVSSLLLHFVDVHHVCSIFFLQIQEIRSLGKSKWTMAQTYCLCIWTEGDDASPNSHVISAAVVGRRSQMQK